MRAHSACISCLISKEDKAIKDLPNESKKAEYMHEVLKILYDHGQNHTAPWLTARLQALQMEYFGVLTDYDEIKHRFNQLLLGQEAVVEEKIRSAEDSIAESIRYVCAGNYIDFGIPQGVQESMLEQMMEKASSEKLDAEELRLFKKDLEKASTLVYLTDNCGEVVLDKIFIKILKECYPSLDITVIVRGKPVINDATMTDMEEIGMVDLVRCIDNGSDVAGTVLEEISQEAKERILSADVIISKGMGNFETLYGSGVVNPYYIFLCKCANFVSRFGMGYYATVFSKEERIQLEED